MKIIETSEKFENSEYFCYLSVIGAWFYKRLRMLFLLLLLLRLKRG
jgi:hypothetical protein